MTRPCKKERNDIMPVYCLKPSAVYENHNLKSYIQSSLNGCWKYRGYTYTHTYRPKIEQWGIQNRTVLYIKLYIESYSSISPPFCSYAATHYTQTLTKTTTTTITTAMTTTTTTTNTVRKILENSLLFSKQVRRKVSSVYWECLSIR